MSVMLDIGAFCGHCELSRKHSGRTLTSADLTGIKLKWIFSSPNDWKPNA